MFCNFGVIATLIRLRPNQCHWAAAVCVSTKRAILMLSDAAVQIVGVADVKMASFAVEHVNPKAHINHFRIPVSRRVDVEGLLVFFFELQKERQPFDIDPPGDRDTENSFSVEQSLMPRHPVPLGQSDRRRRTPSPSGIALRGQTICCPARADSIDPFPLRFYLIAAHE
jgi:hypothetical protein